MSSNAARARVNPWPMSDYYVFQFMDGTWRIARLMNATGPYLPRKLEFDGVFDTEREALAALRAAKPRENAGGRKNAAGYSRLNKILEDRYGVSLLAAPPEAILWAADRLADTAGVPAARGELSAANHRREKMGKIPAYPAFGDRLFDRRMRNPRGKGYKPKDLAGAARAGVLMAYPAAALVANPKGGKLSKKQIKVIHSLVFGRHKPTPEQLAAVNREIEKSQRNPGRRRNHHNDQAALDAYREFHGREPGELLEFDQHWKHPGRTTALGKLEKLKVEIPAGRVRGSRIVTLSGFKGAMLTRHPREVQLYIEGGDQSVGLEEFGITWAPHVDEFLGEVKEVTYFTTKDHLGKEGGTANYVHTFGRNEETGEKTERPRLNYNVDNEQLTISGGGYTIPAEGIDG